MTESTTNDTRVAAAHDAQEVARRSLEALEQQATSTYATSNNFNDLLRMASRHLRRLVDCEVARIWVARRAGQRLVARDFPGGHEEPPIELRIPRGDALAGWAVVHEQPLRIGPGDPRPELTGDIPEFVSALVMPLFRRGEAFGAIECLNKRGGGAFTDADFDRLDVGAEHLAFALDNALLYQETERRALEKEVLLDIAKTLGAPLELEDLIETIFRSLRQVVSYDAAAIYLVNRSTQALELVREVGYPVGSEEAFSLQVGQGIVGWVAKHGQPVIVPDVSADPRYVAARPATRSEVAAPMVHEGHTIGVFNLESDVPDIYHEAHLEMLDAFASHAAVAIERARLTRVLMERRRLEKELAIAREIQESFLPKAAPILLHFDIAGSTIPHDQVGGDYYDFVRVSESRVGLAIADVSGKGIPAALIMAGFRMSLLAEVRNDFAIHAVMRKVNSLLYESIDRDKFVTAFYGVLDVRNRVLSFSNAGHNPPILLRGESDRFEYLEEGGVAFGVLPEAHYEERPLALRTGDLLVLYTDGISECESPEGKMFGTRRLEQTMRRLRERTAKEIMDGIVHEVREWAGERGSTDDLTLIVLKTLEEATPSSTT